MIHRHGVGRQLQGPAELETASVVCRKVSQHTSTGIYPVGQAHTCTMYQTQNSSKARTNSYYHLQSIIFTVHVLYTHVYSGTAMLKDLRNKDTSLTRTLSVVPATEN